MNSTEFLSAILPPIKSGIFGPEQTYYILGLRGDNERVSLRADSVGAIVKQSSELCADGYDTYMAMASFDIYVPGRKANNARSARCLWADLDIAKAGCRYQTREEALQTLVQFSKDTGLKPSIIVSSGKGLHVYWVLNKDVNSAEWKQLAGNFLQLCTEHNLDVDRSRARDISSVLRIPGTIHQKSGTTVSVLLNTGKTYDPEAFGNIAVPVSAPAPVRKKAPVPDDPFGMGPEEPVYDGVEIARNCNQIMTMGSQSYPNWFAAMSVLRRCKNGLAVAKVLSSACPEKYNEADTEKRFYEAYPDRPARCDVFRVNNPDGCKGCKYAAVLNSPASLHRILHSRQAEISKPVVPPQNDSHITIPDWDKDCGYTALNDADDHSHFSVLDDGIHWYPFDPKEKIIEDVRIFQSRLYYIRSEVYIDDAERPHRMHVFRVERPSGWCETVHFDCDKDSGQNVNKWFLNAGIAPLTPRCDTRVMNMLINAYLSKVETDPKERISYDHLGWQDITDPVSKEKHKGFVTGAGAVMSTGLHPVAFGGIARTSIPQMCGHAGTVEKWSFVPKMYRALDQKLGQLAMCFSFAAPLMEIGGGDANNCMLSIWSSETGCGKSQLLKSCASVWGNPKEMFFSKDESITARCRRMSVLNNLPACMDEVTDLTDEDLSNLAFVISSGKEKNKLRASGAEFIRTGRWATCTFLTANKSVKECLARYHTDTSATLQRIMEYRCNFSRYDNPKIREFIQKCAKLYDENYGIAGPEFLIKLFQYPERLVSLRNYVEDWGRRNGFYQEERFMSNALAIALKAGRWAVEFGLLDYDMDALEKWVLRDFVPYNRKATCKAETKWAVAFGDVIQDMSRSTLVVSGANRLPNEPDPGNLVMPDKYVKYRPSNGVILSRYEIRNRVLYISSKAVKEWCQKNNASPGTVLEALRVDGFHIKEERINLGKGVSTIPSARIRVWRLDKDDLDRLDYITPSGKS